MVWGAVIVAVITFAVGIATIVLVAGTVRERAQDELFRQAEVTAGFLEDELGDITLDRDDTLVRQISAARARIAVVMERARVVGGHDVIEAGLILSNRVVPLFGDQQLLTHIPAAGEREVVRTEVDGVRMVATVRRIGLDGGAEIVVAIGRSEPVLPVQFVSRALLLAITVGTVTLIVFAAWFTGATRRRLAGLEDASRRIAGGDLSARAPVDGDDEITAVSVAFNDMAEQLETARARERAFLMAVGHDLRTPLTTIRGYAEALDEGAVDSADMERVASVLHAQTDRLSRLVEDLTLLARLEAREFSLRPEPVDLAAHVKEIVESYRERAGGVHVRLSFTATPVGPVIVDPDRLSQICGNLLDNALRYTPDGGSVAERVESTGGSVRLSVADSGPGIDPDDLPRVFDRLYVAERYRPVRPEGSGLGLSIVKELVDAMEGGGGSGQRARRGNDGHRGSADRTMTAWAREGVASGPRVPRCRHSRSAGPPPRSLWRGGCNR